MKKMKQNEWKGFLKGIAVATFLSSAFLYAGTLIDGIYQFASGEAISSTEMNHNFQTIRGNVIVEATNTSTITSVLSTPTQECEQSFTECNSGYVVFGNETAGSISTRTDPTSTTNYSQTAGGSMSYAAITTDGFYEISLIADPATVTISPPDEAWETTYLDMNFAVIRFDATDINKGEITPNTSAMDTPKVDGTEIYSELELNSSFSRGDNDGDGNEDFYSQSLEPGNKKQLYLKSGEGIAVFYWIKFENIDSPVGTDTVVFNPGNIKIKVKQILD